MLFTIYVKNDHICQNSHRGRFFLKWHSIWALDLICRPRNFKCLPIGTILQSETLNLTAKCFQSVQILSFLVYRCDVMPILNVTLEIILPLSGKIYFDIHISKLAWQLSETFSSMPFSFSLILTGIYFCLKFMFSSLSKFSLIIVFKCQKILVSSFLAPFY